MMRSAIALLSIAGLAACTTTTPQDDPVYLRLTDLEARLMRIERVLDNESLLQIASQLQALRSDTQALRGEVETLGFEAENAAERQRDLYVDLDRRLQALEQAPRQQVSVPAQPAGGGGQFQGGGATVETPPPNATPQTAYDYAFGLIQARRYDEATASFRSFLSNYPNSGLVDNAQYWLAETYYVQGQFETALGEFQKVIDNYPQSAKLPDALLKVGYCNYELRRWDAARQALREVSRQFPDTTAARLAAQRLDVIAREAG